MLLAKLRDGAAAATARMALEMATLGGAACLGRAGELGVLAPGAVGDVAVWSLAGPSFAGADRRPDRGVAALRPGRGARHRRPRSARRRATAPSCTPRSTSACVRTTSSPRACRRRRDGWPVTAIGGRHPPDCAAMAVPDRSDGARGRTGGGRRPAPARLLRRSGRRHRPPPTSEVVVAGSVGAAPPTPANTMVDVDAIAMVGDSITVGSEEELEEAFAALGLDDADINARAAGGWSSTLDHVRPRRHRRRARRGRPARPLGDRARDQRRGQLPAARTTRRRSTSCWRRSRPGRRSSGSTATSTTSDLGRQFDTTLRQVLAARGNATVVDWATVAAEDGVLSDGIHPSPFGRLEFARRVADGVDAWIN